MDNSKLKTRMPSDSTTMSCASCSPMSSLLEQSQARNENVNSLIVQMGYSLLRLLQSLLLPCTISLRACESVARLVNISEDLNTCILSLLRFWMLVGLCTSIMQVKCNSKRHECLMSSEVHRRWMFTFVLCTSLEYKTFVSVQQFPCLLISSLSPPLLVGPWCLSETGHISKIWFRV